QIMDVNAETVAHILHRYQAHRLIHGHTHRPADHQLTVNGQTAERLVLADWNAERGEVLVHRPGEWRREPVE
ncbi:MAG: UDP-2,3-diacylglucosamine diphosphatase, partial [Chromatiaceae bacterium]|nr:UDP-2,3-diacylglucosamine diphosphatase [Chromatiaceae bacterium]